MTNNDEHAEPVSAYQEAAKAEVRVKIATATGRKHYAQEMIMHGIGKVLGYWDETDALAFEAMTPEQRVEFAEVLKREADRAAKVFGYESAWVS